MFECVHTVPQAAVWSCSCLLLLHPCLLTGFTSFSQISCTSWQLADIPAYFSVVTWLFLWHTRSQCYQKPFQQSAATGASLITDAMLVQRIVQVFWLPWQWPAHSSKPCTHSWVSHLVPCSWTLNGLCVDGGPGTLGHFYWVSASLVASMGIEFSAE